MNQNLLKAKLAENGMTQQAVAENIGISLSRFNAKLNEKDGAEFSLGEANAIRNLLGLSVADTDKIFFA